MKQKLKVIKYIIFVIALLQFSLASFAQYEVYSAKTVKNEEMEKENKTVFEDYFPYYSGAELPYFSSDNKVLSEVIEKKVKNFFEKRNQNKTNENSISQEEELQNDDDNKIVPQKIKNEEKIYSPKQIDNETVDDENKFYINADKVSYDDTDGNIYAKGNVEIVSKARGITLRADDAFLDKEHDTIKLFNNVKVIKAGAEMIGETLLIDLNEQNVLMDNPKLNAYSFNITAQEGYIIANDIQMINGTINGTRQTNYSLETRAFQYYENISNDYIGKNGIDRSNIERTTKQSYKINAKEIVLTSYKEHNSILMKKANVYYNNHKILHNSDVEIISDKDKQVVEMSTPEAGTLRGYGTYIGYGYVTKLPNGHTLKLLPSLVYGDSNIGVGIIGRYRSPNFRIEAGWSTSTTNAIVKGQYRLTDSLKLRYGRNAYLSESFLGARRSGYAAQLEYNKRYVVDGLKDLNYIQGIYAGFFSDYKKHNQENAYATTRFRYTGQLRKNFIEYKNEEQDLSVRFAGMAEGAATLYGSGQTVGIIKVGPVLSTKFHGWNSSIGYMIGGIHGDSPFYFDKYRYGKQTILLNEQFRIGNKFSIGYRANITPMKDNIEKDLLSESRFYAVFGPDDLKVVLSYDFVRDIAHFEFMFLLGSDSTHINFERLITKDIESKREKRDFYKYAKPVKIIEPANI